MKTGGIIAADNGDLIPETIIPVHLQQAVVQQAAAFLVAVQALAVRYPAHIRHQVEKPVVAGVVDVLFDQLVAVAHVQLSKKHTLFAERKA